jgi:hypothetical protein
VQHLYPFLQNVKPFLQFGNLVFQLTVIRRNIVKFPILLVHGRLDVLDVAFQLPVRNPVCLRRRQTSDENVPTDSANPSTAISTVISTVTIRQLLPPPQYRMPDRLRHIFRRDLPAEQPPRPY